MTTQQRIWLIGGGVLAAILILVFAQTLTSDAYVNNIRGNRAQKDERFRNAADSPVPKAARDTFPGLPYFEVDKAFKFEATFEPQQAPYAKTPLEQNADLDYAGRVRFRHAGKEMELTAFWKTTPSAKKLFIPFYDATSGAETYGGGRYVDAPILPGNTVNLDFNTAYNPQCAYTPDFVCPKPPPENRLPFEVRAGEKNFPYASAKED